MSVLERRIMNCNWCMQISPFGRHMYLVMETQLNTMQYKLHLRTLPKRFGARSLALSILPWIRPHNLHMPTPWKKIEEAPSLTPLPATLSPPAIYTRWSLIKIWFLTVASKVPATLLSCSSRPRPSLLPRGYLPLFFLTAGSPCTACRDKLAGGEPMPTTFFTELVWIWPSIWTNDDVGSRRGGGAICMHLR